MTDDIVSILSYSDVRFAIRSNSLEELIVLCSLFIYWELWSHLRSSASLNATLRSRCIWVLPILTHLLTSSISSSRRCIPWRSKNSRTATRCFSDFIFFCSKNFWKLRAICAIWRFSTNSSISSSRAPSTIELPICQSLFFIPLQSEYLSSSIFFAAWDPYFVCLENRGGEVGAKAQSCILLSFLLGLLIMASSCSRICDLLFSVSLLVPSILTVENPRWFNQVLVGRFDGGVFTLEYDESEGWLKGDIQVSVGVLTSEKDRELRKSLLLIVPLALLWLQARLEETSIFCLLLCTHVRRFFRATCGVARPPKSWKGIISSGIRLD